MLNHFKEVNWHPDTAARRVFAKSLMIGFPCLATLFLFAGRLKSGAWNPALPLQLATIGAGAGALFWLAPAIAKPFYVVGYALACCIGLVVGNEEGARGLLFYLLVYLFMNLGTFAVILSMKVNGRYVEQISDLSGMGKWLMVGVLLLIVASLANIWLQLPSLMLTVMVLAIAIFSAFILVDVQRVVNGGETNYIMATLAIYLDVYNVFTNLLALLGIFGGNRD